MRSYIKNSCFVLHRGFQTPQNKKSTRASASCFHLFRGVWISRWSNWRSFLIYYFPVPRNTATSKIGYGVTSSLWQLRCHCNPDHNFFSSLSNTAVKIIFPNSYRAFSLTWLTSIQIYWNKRKRLHRKRVQFPQDWFGTPIWPPFHCFGTPIWPPFYCFATPIWPPWRHVKTLY